MSTAAAKKNAHIVEYVLYVWQMEDLVRAAQFSETAIEGLFNGEGGADCDWLLKLNTQMQREKLEEKGHISDVLEVQTELALLHDLLTVPWRMRSTSAPSRLLSRFCRNWSKTKWGRACAIRPKPC